MGEEVHPVGAGIKGVEDARENEEGEECMGWIQNYKLTEFKVPRNK